MKLAITTIVLATLGLGIASVQAAPLHRDHHYRNVSGLSGGPAYQGGVLRGPLYNGQDYLGNDPDPNIRSYLLRDLSGRYGGGR
jgi:hypothetical protein